MNEKYLIKLFQSKYIIRKHDFSQKEKNQFLLKICQVSFQNLYSPLIIPNKINQRSCFSTVCLRLKIAI